MPLLPAKHGIHVNDEISNNRIYIYIYRICIYIDICIYIYNGNKYKGYMNISIMVCGSPSILGILTMGNF